MKELYETYQKSIKNNGIIEYFIFICIVLGFACAIYEITHRPYEILVIILGFIFIVCAAVLEQITLHKKKKAKETFLSAIVTNCVNHDFHFTFLSNKQKMKYLKGIMSKESLDSISSPLFFTHNNGDVITISYVEEKSQKGVYLTQQIQGNVVSKIIDLPYPIVKCNSLMDTNEFIQNLKKIFDFVS